MFKIAPEKRVQVAEYLRQWSRDTIREGSRRRIQEATEAAFRSGMSDEDVLAEVRKAIRRAKRKRARVYALSDKSSRN